MPVEIVMPSLGMYTIEGEVTKWLVPSGAAVEGDQPVLELTTEKSTVEITAPTAGILHHVLPVGGQVKVQGLLGYILAPGEAPPAVVPPHLPVPSPTRGDGDLRRPTAVPLSRLGRGARGEGDRSASPLARRRSAELGVDLAQVTGTGPGGRITEADVDAAATRRVAAGGAAAAAGAAGSAAAAPPALPLGAPPGVPVVRRVPLSGMRGLIARRMQHSLATTAQLTLTREIEATALVRARETLAATAPDSRVSYDALLAKALAAALLEHPALNAVVEGQTILVLGAVHVGVAAAVDGGLVVPVLRDPAHRPAVELARELATLAERARRGYLRPEDMEGGTITLTNLGAHGVDTFTPILNPPQSAILGVGRIAPRPFVGQDGQLTARPTVHLSLTFDHRVADGVAAAALLDAVARHCAALDGT
ncbi:MAG: 2-oxo acid dehydrogenase subunit E2 [Chloroflexi bacterium]|nr:2-oxo acid dehydrogenase subunit E2 [Chloroflexota bacterium]